MLLKDIALLTAGVITKRVIEDEKSENNNGEEILLLPPKAIQNGRIDHTLLQRETLIEGKDISKFLTREGDIVLKLSSPYDSVIIQKEDEGLLLPSFLLRIEITDKNINPSYLLAYLNSSLFKESLKKSCYGSVTALVKKSDLDALDIPILSEDKMNEIASRYERMRKIKDKLEEYTDLEEERLNAIWRENNG